MNEQERIQSFNLNVDHLIATGQLPDESNLGTDSDLLEVATLLMQTNLSAGNPQVDVIRQHLLNIAEDLFSQPAHRKPYPAIAHKPLRMLAMSAATVIVLSLMVLVVPPLRTLAQDILQQVGILQFTDETTIPEQLAGTPGESREPNITNSTLLTREESSLEAGFPVYEPTYAPPGYRLSNRDVHIGTRGIQVTTGFIADMDEGIDILNISQWQFNESADDPIQWAIGSGTPMEVVVNGNRGVYVPDAPTGVTVDTNNINQVVGVNILTWEQDGYLFILQSYHLELEELQNIAESLVP